jgi:hypothetical protein
MTYDTLSPQRTCLGAENIIGPILG